MPPNTSLDPRPTASTLDTHHDGTNTRGPQHGHERTAADFPPRYSSRAPFPTYGGETWMAFLRESGADQAVNHALLPTNNPAATPAEIRQPQLRSASSTSSSSSSSSSSPYTLPSRAIARTDSSSSDRKRRLTTADSPMRRPSGIRAHSGNTGASSADPILVDSSPPGPARMAAPLPPLPPLSPLSARSMPGRTMRQNELVLPRWQPDSEVSQCPVCSSHFTFLFRKHHCRKCGRVVCSSCSPHRITIPRQFIVQSPSDNVAAPIDLTHDDETTMSTFGPFRNPALGGGEEVRVCNPCVPDPNYSPPPHYLAAVSPGYPHHVPDPSRSPYVPHPQLHQARHHRSASRSHPAPPPGAHDPSNRSRDSSGNPSDNRRVSYHGPPNPTDRWLPPLPDASGRTPRPYPQGPSASRPIATNISSSNPAAPPFRSASLAGSSSSNLFPRPAGVPVPQRLPSPPPPPVPRRQVAEEDECPVCGAELPPTGPDESLRTGHIEACIALHSASPAPGAATTQQVSASLPNQRVRGMSSAGGGGEGVGGIGEIGSGNGSASRSTAAAHPHRLSHASRGMFPYTATEKDCIDDEGRDAECIICLEDFETGVKMARLVCWCKFHEKCIQEWWDKKGRGACPTHQLQE